MDYQNSTIKQLRAIAKEHDLKHYSALRKAELITFLSKELPQTTLQGDLIPTQSQVKIEQPNPRHVKKNNQNM